MEIITIEEVPSDEGVLAKTLESNPLATVLSINLEGEEQQDWPSFSKIAERNNLERVELSNICMPDLVGGILTPIQQIPVLQHVQLQRLVLPSNFHTFLQNAPSLTTLEIAHCSIKEQGRASLKGMMHTANMKTLRIAYLDESFLISILEGLQTNTTLEFLSVGGHESYDCGLQCYSATFGSPRFQHHEVGISSVSRQQWVSTCCHSTEAEPESLPFDI